MTAENEQAFRQPCLEYFDIMLYCYTPVNQFSSYYRTGWVDDCVRARDQFGLCIQLKFDRPDEERTMMHRRLKKLGEHAVTAGVWEMRDSPKADWEAPCPPSADTSKDKL